LKPSECREWTGLAIHRHLSFLHRFEKRRLRLRWGAVDLVCEQDVREHRPFAKLECPNLRVIDERAGDVSRHEVGRELHALGVEAEGATERSHQQSLRDTRNSFEQHVPAGQERDGQAGDCGILTDDSLANLGSQAQERFAEFGINHGSIVSFCVGRFCQGWKSVGVDVGWDFCSTRRRVVTLHHGRAASRPHRLLDVAFEAEERIR